MRGAWTIFRSGLRRRWASWVALALLVAVVGGIALAGASAARRTSNAISDFERAHGYDVFVGWFSDSPVRLPDLGSVAASASSIGYANGNVVASGQLIPMDSVNVSSLPTGHVAVLKLVSGSLPSRVGDVAVGLATAQQFHLVTGDLVSVPFFARNQRVPPTGSPRPRGPTSTFHVVGIVTSMADFPSPSPSFFIYTSRAFDRSVGSRIDQGTYIYLRLKEGNAGYTAFQQATNNLTAGNANIYELPVDPGVASVQSALQPQAVGWWIVALLAGLVGLALLAQALSRASVLERDEHPTLSSLGATRGQLFVVGVARAIFVGVLGACGAVAVAVAVSPLTPVGLARDAISVGVSLDPSVAAVGTAAVVVVVTLLGLAPAWRDARVGAVLDSEGRRVAQRQSEVIGRLARAGASPRVLVGVRHALERGRGRSGVPVGTALVGTVFAVAALVGTVVFGSSLTTLLHTPRLYGQSWRVELSGVPTSNLRSVVDTAKRSPAVSAVTLAINGKYFEVNGFPVSSTLATSAKGPLVFSVVSGHLPTVGGIDLGTQTLRAAHASVGRVAKLFVLLGNKGTGGIAPVTVDGTIAFPPSYGLGSLGDGAVVPLSTLAEIVCKHMHASSSGCPPSIVARFERIPQATWEVSIRTVHGPVGNHEALYLATRYSSWNVAATVPTNLVNFGEAVNFPALLAIILAIFGAAMLAHLLLVSVARRRREFALLKVLGFTRRDVRVAVQWQATTVAVVGGAVGVPVGIAIGRWVWQRFAIGLGAVSVVEVPVLLVGAVAVGVLVFANILGLIPGRLASAPRPSEQLRER